VSHNTRQYSVFALLTLALPLAISACGDPEETESASTSDTETSGDTVVGTSETTDTPTGTSETETAGPTTDPSTTDPSTTDPSTTDPSTTDPSTTDPSTTDPSTTDPSTTDTSDSDTEGETDTGMNDGVVRFIALGDGGEGNDTQYAVANAVEMVCAERGCDFALYLGDNFYDTGVDSPQDGQFQSKFEMPYADIGFPFYIVFGNHDYGMLANQWGKADYQIEYTQYSDKWTCPAKWYDFQQENVHFFGLDTSRIFWDHEWDQQKDWLTSGIQNSDATWKIAYGHHPYISNGAHGNAGNYEGFDFIPIVSGEAVEDFMDDAVCNQIDIYFCGHDHNRQWLEERCGTEFIVSGAAAKNTDFEHHDDNPVHWEDDQRAGFMWVEIEGNQMTGIFFDEDGNLEFERTITK
ncbi:MAG: metallophosphoesterase, partial [Nannocystaceae bacterium]